MKNSFHKNLKHYYSFIQNPVSISLSSTSNKEYVKYNELIEILEFILQNYLVLCKESCEKYFGRQYFENIQETEVHTAVQAM